MNLVKTSFYTAISTAVTFISGFIVTKVVAVKIGPTGIALVGQYQNTITILAMIATGAIASGVIKYLATYKDDHENQQRVITTALSIVLLCSVAVSIFVISTCVFLSQTTFHTEMYWEVYALYAVFVILISLNTLIGAVFNGLKQIKTLTIVNIVGSLSGIASTLIFAHYFGVKGVLVSSNFMALTMFVINIYFLRKVRGFSWKPSFRNWDKNMVRLLMAFTLMNLVSGLLTPITQLLIRNKIMLDFTIDEAGYWQAVTRISDYYIGFITTVLSVYYLPRLAELKEKHELRKEIKKGYTLILPTVGILALTIFLCKSLIVHILFDQTFLPMLPLFKYQLLGDFFKIGSWLLAFLMLSKAITRVYIYTEVFFSVLFLSSSYVLIGNFGIIGTTYAFAFSYAIYWLLMWFLLKKYII